MPPGSTKLRPSETIYSSAQRSNGASRQLGSSSRPTVYPTLLYDVTLSKPVVRRGFRPVSREITSRRFRTCEASTSPRPRLSDISGAVLRCRPDDLIACELHKIPSEPARDTASERVVTASFRKMRLTCDFTVSGEILRVRAMRLLGKPWLIFTRISRSRAVRVSLTRLLRSVERQSA
jgi:hypothetical protein